ncbi:MAG TPA: hypothetical protein VMV10_05640 [Pirellulales bacterium]|nr:hypothetical protein [Pirellulales bacterium]
MNPRTHRNTSPAEFGVIDQFIGGAARPACYAPLVCTIWPEIGKRVTLAGHGFWGKTAPKRFGGSRDRENAKGRKGENAKGERFLKAVFKKFKLTPFFFLSNFAFSPFRVFAIFVAGSMSPSHRALFG